jgi:hypothetical protein
VIAVTAFWRWLNFCLHVRLSKGRRSSAEWALNADQDD